MGKKKLKKERRCPPEGYRRTLIGFTAWETTYESFNRRGMVRPSKQFESLEDAEGVWIDGEGEEAEEDGEDVST